MLRLLEWSIVASPDAAITALAVGDVRTADEATALAVEWMGQLAAQLGRA